MTGQVLSNADALLAAVPLVGVLFLSYFRVDEMIGKSNKNKGSKAKSGQNKKGHPLSVDPDGNPLG